MNPGRLQLLALALAGLLAFAPAAAADETAPPADGYGAFALVTARNIFNPNRSRDLNASPDTTATVETTASLTTASVERLNLVGTWVTPGRAVAFVTGAGPGLTSATVGTQLEGLEVRAINSRAVVVAQSAGEVRWPVGQRLERSPGAAWEVKGAALATSGTRQVKAEPAGGAGAPASDIVKRMMERRKRERRR